ncbi:MAG: site-specific DNA-methyltransferase [Candidatus Acidiferrales bacterium]
MPKKPKAAKTVAALKHKEARRTNIPTAEYQSVVEKELKAPVKLQYPRTAYGLEKEKKERNKDLDPQLIWRGKDQQDWSDLVVNAPPLYIQEKVKPKVLIDDLLAESSRGEARQAGGSADLFGDFNGLPEGADKTDFYHYEGNWQNRMILGDSLQVMASLAEREGLRGKVQCIYLDPPYGIKFNSNFQWSTTSRDVKDGNAEHITREPEQVKAFRDTWRDGIHSYLTYLRDRLTVARDLLTESGSIFVQIGDENVHRVRAVMDEVFGDENLIAQVAFRKTGGKGGSFVDNVTNYICWYARDREKAKFRTAYRERPLAMIASGYNWIEDDSGATRRLTSSERSDILAVKPGRLFQSSILVSQSGGEKTRFPVQLDGSSFSPSRNTFWKTNQKGMGALHRSGRLMGVSGTLAYKRYERDFPVVQINALWDDTIESTFAVDKIYVVQTATKVIQRCILMSTDPGDLVLDPTCGSGTTAYVAEQWGRRWITIDTSRVALALARARIMGARYSYYLLADSREGQLKEAEVTRSVPKTTPTWGNIGLGFVYERVPHITLKSIANNTEIDVIWDKFQQTLEPLREQLNTALVGWAERSEAQQSGKSNVGHRSRSAQPTTVCKPFEEWEIPREADANWAEAAKKLHAEWWRQRIARQKEIDASIAAKADFENLYDKPYEDKKKVRVAGPFTVESLSPHRVLGVDEHGDVIDGVKDSTGDEHDFARMILENLKAAGVQQAHKDGRISFTSLTPWPGELVCAEGRYLEGTKEKRAGIFIGPEFGTVSRPDLVEAAREAGDAGFDVLIACAFGYDAHSSEFEKLGRIPVLKARMNADLHMADDLKNTGKGNLFVIFGEPDIDVLDAGNGQIKVKVNGVDVFKPQTGEVVSDGPDGIACWFVDTDYNEESFFVRHAYFLGANDPYKSLKITLKAEINPDAWETLHSDTSRPFPKPETGRIAVKVINHLGDEVMKVFKVL